jgi:hypothetical protein
VEGCRIIPMFVLAVLAVFEAGVILWLGDKVRHLKEQLRIRAKYIREVHADEVPEL